MQASFEGIPHARVQDGHSKRAYAVNADYHSRVHLRVMPLTRKPYDVPRYAAALLQTVRSNTEAAMCEGSPAQTPGARARIVDSDLLDAKIDNRTEKGLSQFVNNATGGRGSGGSRAH